MLVHCSNALVGHILGKFRASANVGDDGMLIDSIMQSEQTCWTNHVKFLCLQPAI